MHLAIILISTLISATSVTITEPADGETYDGDWLTVRAIVENENEIPDSVHYSLNGGQVTLIPRLNTDWPTYMQSYLHHGFSESPAPTDNTILWTAPVTGEDHEFPTPVVVDGIVYYASNSGTDSLYALDAASGDLIWKQRVGYTDDAATVHEDRIYIASDSLFCFDAQTGDRIWVSGAADWCGSTPVVTGGRVYCGTGPSSSSQPDTSNVVCLDTTDGSTIWSRTLYDAWLVSCMTVWGDLVIVPTYLANIGSPLYALDRETGATVWENSDAPIGYWDSSPVIVDGTIYINDSVVAARAIDALTGLTVWVSTYGSGSESTPAYHDGRLYYGRSEYYCLDASSGGGIWSVPGDQHGSSAIADGMVFYGQMNIPDNGGLRALDCETGAEVWSYYPPGTVWIAGSPSVVDGVVYMPMHDWNLYAFGTGLKYTYLDDLFAQVGVNDLIVTSFDEGVEAASDTISFTVTGTGIDLEPSNLLNLCATPNPFRSVATVSFEVSEPGFTSVRIFDLAGRNIASLVDTELPQGSHSMQWNGLNENGEPVSAGLYLCRIESGGVIETTGLCLLR